MVLFLMVIPVVAAASEAPPVDAGELHGSAYTLLEGTTRIGLNTEVAHGFRPGLQAGTRVLQWAKGPNAWLEWSFRDSGSSAWALSSTFDLERDGEYVYSHSIRHTMGPRDGSRVSVGLGWWEALDDSQMWTAYGSYTVRTRYGGLFVPVGVDLVAGRHTIQLQGGVMPVVSDLDDSLLLGEVELDQVTWNAGAWWATGWKVFRMSAGVTASSHVSDDYARLMHGLGLDVPEVEVAPRLRLWWAF